LRALKAQILEFDRRIIAWHRSSATSQRLDAIPGVGPALATALVAHPEQIELAEKIDSLLRHDGYTLAQAGRISGSPFYAVRPAPTGSPADESISATLAAFDPTQVHARWTIAMERRTSEPAGAITLARTLLEDVCKWILDQAGETWQEADDLPVLYRKLAKVLKLAPDEHTEQVFKQILGSWQSVVESLGCVYRKPYPGLSNDRIG
jgi:hypothetical protein